MQTAMQLRNTYAVACSFQCEYGYANKRNLKLMKLILFLKCKKSIEGFECFISSIYYLDIIGQGIGLQWVMNNLSQLKDRLCIYTIVSRYDNDDSTCEKKNRFRIQK